LPQGSSLGALAYCHAEDLRGLLGRVLDEVEDLCPELREAIEQVLR
jgi:hypothetical protein